VSSVVHRRRLQLTPVPPFDLELALHGHGWCSLPPHEWDATRKELHTTLLLDGSATDATVRQVGARLQVALAAASPLGESTVAGARSLLTHSLRLREDLTRFWRLCEREPRLRWVAARGAGRLQRSPTVFEDLLKLLFTTNCSWAATTGMARNLVEALGPRSPSGRSAFPDAARCARNEKFYVDVVRCGYRAQACVELAEGFASGRLRDADFLDPELPTDEIRRRLLSLRGFGPYAAGQALRLLGRYDDFALDSWCQSKLCELSGRRRPPSERSLARRYSAFGEYRGLALWMDLTASWHGEEATA